MNPTDMARERDAARSLAVALEQQLAAVRALAIELAAYDCCVEPVPAGIDVPDDYEYGLNETAKRLHAVLNGEPTR